MSRTLKKGHWLESSWWQVYTYTTLQKFTLPISSYAFHGLYDIVAVRLSGFSAKYGAFTPHSATTLASGSFRCFFFVGLCVEPLVVMAFVLLHIDFELRGSEASSTKNQKPAAEQAAFWWLLGTTMDSISSTWAAPDFTLQLPAGQHQARLQVPRATRASFQGRVGKCHHTRHKKSHCHNARSECFANTAINMAGKTVYPCLPLKMKRSFVGGSMAPHWLDPHPTDGQQWPAVVHPFSSDASMFDLP